MARVIAAAGLLLALLAVSAYAAESYDAKEYDSPAPYQQETYQEESYEKPAHYKKSRDHSHYKKAYADEEPAYEAKESYGSYKQTYEAPAYEAKDSYVKDPYAKKDYSTKDSAYGYKKDSSYSAKRDYSSHKQSFETVCLQEVPDTCNLGLAINLDLCDILALRLSSNFECCTALAPRNGTDARIAAKNSRAQHAAQMLQLYGNTDACRWDFTFGADIINQIIEDPSVSGIDSPGVLPIGKAIATCFFSDNLKSCGPFCDDMTLRAETDMFLTWGVSADGQLGCLLDNYLPFITPLTGSDNRTVTVKQSADKSSQSALAFMQKLTAAAKNMADQTPARLGARKDVAAAGKKHSHHHESSAAYKRYFDPLAGGAASFPVDELKAGVFAIFSGSFTGAVNGVADDGLQGRFSFTPIFYPVPKYDEDIPEYLEVYPDLPFSRAGQLNMRFAHREEEEGGSSY